MSLYESLSGNDLIMHFKNPPNLIMYSDLKKYHSIGQLLGRTGKCILLYRNSENNGHWCCLYKYKGVLHFFDSYGFVPDDQLKFAQPHLRPNLRQDYKHLTKMMLESGMPVEYNEYELQDYSDPRMATCGRWCVVRLQHPEVSIKDFNRIFKNKRLSPDEIVLRLTT